jgi:hypothetical protein
MTKTQLISALWGTECPSNTEVIVCAPEECKEHSILEIASVMVESDHGTDEPFIRIYLMEPEGEAVNA